MLGDRLICLHERQKVEGWLWHTAFDGVVWYENVKLQQVLGKGGSYGTSDPLALITQGNQLFRSTVGTLTDTRFLSLSSSELMMYMLTSAHLDFVSETTNSRWNTTELLKTAGSTFSLW